MATNTKEVPFTSVGSGKLNVATAGTARPLSDGVIALATASMTDTSIAFVAATASTGPTLTDSNSGFVTAGFTKGMSIRVTGSTSNDGTYRIANVVAGTITLTGETDLTGEAAGDTVTIYENVKIEAVDIHADSGNAGVCYVGNANVSSANGRVLQAEQSISIAVDDLSSIYVDAANNDEDVTFLFGYTRMSR